MDDDGASLWRHEHLQQVPPPEPRARRGRAEQSLEPLPDWAREKAALEQAPAPWLAPSHAAAAFDRRVTFDVVRSPLAPKDDIGFRRGALIHRLLQSLPAIAPGLRAERAAKYLALKGHGLSPADQQEIAITVLRLLEHEGFGGVFAEGSMPEVPIVARVRLSGDRTLAIDGRIDRLLVAPSEVLILDFKSNRPPPDSLANVDAAYVRQLALYRRAMLDVFPGRAVRAALLWTEGPNLMELPESLMEAHLI
jgi:ATP-dependent helicase/nuclease subunit A